METNQFIDWNVQPFFSGCHLDIKSTDFNIVTFGELVHVVETTLDDIAIEEYVNPSYEIDLLESSLLITTRTKNPLGNTIINNSYMTYTGYVTENCGIFIFYDTNNHYVKLKDNDIKLASKYFIKFKQ